MPSFHNILSEKIKRSILDRFLFHLEKILRVRESSSLIDVDRNAVRGELGQATRSTPVDIDSLIELLIIESGLWVTINQNYGIYISQLLLSYFEDSGDSWDWGQSDHVHGQIDIGTYLCTVGNAPDFSGPPELTDTLYPSLASQQKQQDWINDENRRPFRCTGLMRLLAQSFGPHKNIRALRPIGWPAWQVTNYGVVRQVDAMAQTLRYWLIYVGDQGCKAVALEHDQAVNCLVHGLYNGTYSGDQQLRAEAAVLSALSLPDGYVSQDLLTSAEMGPVYAGGFGPLAHGWHWSPQRWGTASETSTEAIMLSVNETDTGNGWGWDTKRCTITINFSDTTASANLSVGTTGRTGLTRLKHRLYIYGNEAGFYKHTERIEGQELSAGDIWGVYRETGPEWINYQPTTASSARPAQNYKGAVGACGGGGSSNRFVEGGSVLWSKGGFDVEGGIVWSQSYRKRREILSSSASAAGTLNSFFVNNGGVNQVDGSTSGTLWNNGTLTGICNPTENRQTCIDGGSPVTINLVTVYVWRSRPYYYSFEDAGASLLITADPTVFISMMQEKGVTDGSWNEDLYVRGPHAGGCSWQPPEGGSGCSGNHTYAVGCYHSGLISGAAGSTCFHSPSGQYGDQASIGSSFTINITQPDETYEKHPGGTEVTTEQAIVFHGDGISKTLGDSFFGVYSPGEDPYHEMISVFTRSVVTTDYTGPIARASYSGKFVYDAKVGDGWESDNKFDDIIAASDYLSFLGHE